MVSSISLQEVGMSAMFRPVRWGSAAMIALFTGAIGYNVFFIQSALKQGGREAVVVRPDRLGKLVAFVEAEKPARLVRVSVNPSGMRGNSGNAAYAALVLATQRELAALGYYKGPVDGRYGPATRNAIIAFQKQAELPITGRPDQKTLDRLMYERKLANAARFTASLPPEKVDVAQVRKVQERLARLGYQPGPVDGRIGAKTRTAIRQFQKDRGLPATGRIDNRFLKALGV